MRLSTTLDVFKANNDSVLSKRYPLGYWLIGIDKSDLIVPHGMNVYTYFDVDWATVKVERKGNLGMSVVLPKIVQKVSKNSMYGDTINVRGEINGKKICIYHVGNQEIWFESRILGSDLVMIFGFSESENN